MRLVQISKTWGKTIAASVLFHAGLLRRLAHRRLRNGAIVLMYHRVLPEDRAAQSFSHPGIVVTPATFERQMALLKREFRPLSLQDFLGHMEARIPFPDGACLVTFDDGWIDNHDYALPILRRHGVPAVVFVATDYIESDRSFWQETLGYLLYEASRHRLGEAVLRLHQIELPGPSDDSSLRQHIEATIDRFRGKSYESIYRLIDALSDVLAASAPPGSMASPDRFMTWDQVRCLADSGVSIASHTHSHRLLPRLEESAIREELAQSRRILTEKIGTSFPAVAYPGGQYNEAVRHVTIECGYQLAFTTDAGVARLTGDPFLVPRVNIHEAATRTIPLFLSRIAGLL